MREFLRVWAENAHSAYSIRPDENDTITPGTDKSLLSPRECLRHLSKHGSELG